MKQNTIAAEINAEFITAQAGAWQAAADKAKAAAEAYLADLEARKATLDEQSAGYKAELDQLHEQRTNLATTINDLTSRGRVDEVLGLDAEMESLCKSIETVERKISILGKAKLKGDQELYNAAKAAHAAAEAERAHYRENIAALQQIVKAEIDRLEKVERELSSAISRDVGYYAAQTFEKVKRHFLDLDRLAREAVEKAAAERKAAEAERGSVRRSFF